MSYNTTNRLFETNNYSIVSKYSAIRSGYFEDNLLKELIENHLNVKSWRRTPIVNRGYAARLMAMDWILSRSIISESLDCIIVLGAGFDMSAFRYPQCCWIEIDLPQVVEVKVKFLNDKKVSGQSGLLEIESGIFGSVSQNYYLITCDLQNSDRLSYCLNQVLRFLDDSRKKRFALVNEVCLCYLELNAITRIFEIIIDRLRESALRVHYIGYEQVKPNQDSQFSDVMLHHFKSLGHPLKYFPTTDQIKQLFCNQLKFSHVTVISMYQVYHNVLLATRLESKGFQEEPFDEFEEMDLYLGHYALVTGVLVLKDPMIELYTNQSLHEGPIVDSELSSKLEDCNLKSTNGRTDLIASSLRRFGHASCILGQTHLSSSSFIVTGGFGISQIASELENDKLQHKRLHDCLVVAVDIAARQSQVVNVELKQLESNSIRLDRVHGQIGQVYQNLIFFNGGRQSPIENKAYNKSFVGELDDNHHLSVRHKFNFEDNQQSMRWRHKLSRIHGDRMFQVGGLGIDTLYPMIMWNFSSDKLGLDPIAFGNERNSDIIDRHSFGMDTRYDGTLLLFGGLKTLSSHRDRPVESRSAAVLWDFRSNELIKLNSEFDQCYNADVHFISDNHFVKIGGISCETGIEEPFVELMDLRSTGKITVSKNPLIDENDFVMLINSTSCYLSSDNAVVTTGGGGNQFTLGTCFSRSHLVLNCVS